MFRLDLTADRPKPHGKCQVWCGFDRSPGPFPSGKGSQRGTRQPLLSRASGQCGAGWPRLRREGMDNTLGPLPSPPPEQAPGEGKCAWPSLQATGVRP